jgi:aminomuconate-semialdehyde/2-hydroxymuconate-6-semialdehyde dehydrogenase
MNQIQNFINGEFADGVRTFDKRSPVTGQVIAQVHEARPRRGRRGGGRPRVRR